MHTHTLYASPPPRRFYLIPDGVELPTGELELTSLTGARIRVDPDVAAIWDVDEDEARRWGAERLRDLGGQLLQALSPATSRQRPPSPRSPRIPAAPPAQDPDTLREPLTRHLESWKQDLKRVVEETRAKPAEIERRAARLAEVAEAQGQPELARAARGAPQALRGWLADPKRVGELREASARLRQASDELRAKRRAARGDPEP